MLKKMPALFIWAYCTLDTHFTRLHFMHALVVPWKRGKVLMSLDAACPLVGDLLLHCYSYLCWPIVPEVAPRGPGFARGA